MYKQIDHTSYPYWTESNETNDPNVLRNNLLGGTVNPNQIQTKGWFTNITPSLYYQQRNTFIMQQVDRVFRKLKGDDFFDSVFPKYRNDDKTLLTITFSADPYAAERSAPASPTVFTQEHFEYFMSTSDWFATGMYVPFHFDATKIGQIIFEYRLALLTQALILANKLLAYNTLNLQSEFYITWLTKEYESNPIDLLKTIIKREKKTHNIATENKFAMEWIDEGLDEEETQSGMTETNVYICHPKCDNLRRKTGNYENKNTGQYGSKESVQNKPQSGQKAYIINGKKIFYQPRLLISGSLTVQLLEHIGSLGDHVAFPNAIIHDPYKTKSDIRIVKIHDSNTDRMTPITMKNALNAAINQMVTSGIDLNKIYTDDTLGSLSDKYRYDSRQNDILMYCIKTYHRFMMEKYGLNETNEDRLFKLNTFGTTTNNTQSILNAITPHANTQHIKPHEITKSDVFKGGISTFISENYRSDGFNMYDYIDTIVNWYEKLFPANKDPDLKEKLYYISIYEGNYVLDFYGQTDILFQANHMNNNDLYHRNTIVKAEIQTIETDVFKNKEFESMSCGLKIATYLFTNILICDRNTQKIHKNVFSNLAEHGIECGVNVLLTRPNQLYIYGKIFRVQDSGKTLKVAIGNPYVNIYDDNRAELHFITYREMKGGHFIDPKISVVRNAVVNGHITGGGTLDAKDYSIFEKEYHKIDDYKNKGDIYYFLIPMYEKCVDEIVYSKARDYFDMSISKLTNETYDGKLTNIFNITNYIEVLQENVYKDLNNASKRVNKISCLCPHDYIDEFGKEKSNPGNGHWKYAYDGCNRVRFGEILPDILELKK